jgi:DNA (cytosine-5)-methyltransferase 1
VAGLAVLKPRALDLFCGAGGATKGLQLAGFHVTGVDIKPQPRYCGDEFHQADALTFPLEGYDFIWASPPCQAWTIAGKNARRDGKVYPELIAPIRERLKALGVPWVIENVPGAPITAHLVLCGSNFGLRVARHRGFEMWHEEFRLANSCAHASDLVTVCGDGTPSWSRKARVKRGLPPDVTVAEKRIVLQTPWMNRHEMAESIPPAYSEFIGKQVLEHIGARA